LSFIYVKKLLEIGLFDRINFKYRTVTNPCLLSLAASVGDVVCITGFVNKPVFNFDYKLG